MAESLLQGEVSLTRAVQEVEAFEMAEAAWLGAQAAWRTLAADPAANDHTAEATLWRAERQASLTFALIPSPTLLYLPRKMWLIEREAFEVAHNNACGKDLTVWLAALRLDLMRLLAQPAP